MRISAVRTTILLLALASIAFTANLAAQSSGQNGSLWNKTKNAANQPNQQKQPNAQPQTPGQMPGQISAPGQKQSASAQVNDTGPFTPPPGTKIDEALMAPVEQGAAFGVSPQAFTWPLCRTAAVAWSSSTTVCPGQSSTRFSLKV